MRQTACFSRLFVLAACAALVACGGEGAPAAPADGGAHGEAAQEAVESLTIHSTASATPGAPTTVLTQKHPGWRRVGCHTSGCHATTHGGDSPASCSVCHGGNGADRMKPRPEHGLADKACGGCHGSKHPEVKLRDPVECATCHKYEETTGCPATRKADVVVVGAGGGGLAAAASLARAGKKVVVIEKHYKVGGYMTGFRRKGYRFEVSLHGFDGLDPGGTNVEIFKELGIWDRVKPIKQPTIYRVVYPGFAFSVPQDIEQYRSALKQRFPGEAAGIDALFQESEFADRFLRAYMAYEAGQTPDLPPLPDLLRFQQLSQQSLATFLKQHIKDPLLLTLYTQLVGFAGTEPEQLSAAYFLVMWTSYHRYGYYNFVGGSESVVRALADVVEENGGTIRLGTLATRIVVDKGRAVRVETDDDLCYEADHVVSNASGPATINKLIGADKVDKSDRDTYAKWKVGLSAFVVYLGVDVDYSKAFVNTHEIMVSETLDPHQNFKTVDDCDVERTPFTLSNLTMIDPSTAPPGKNVIEITGQLGYDCGKQWGWAGGHASHRAAKEKIAAALVRRAERFLPDLRGHLEVVEVASPVTLSMFTLNPRGSIFGWDNIISQSMTARMATTQLKGIDNLYMAGAWSFPGGGQSAVLMSGANAARAILKQ